MDKMATKEILKLFPERKENKSENKSEKDGVTSQSCGSVTVIVPLPALPLLLSLPNCSKKDEKSEKES